jgi:hypothetical protein
MPFEILPIENGNCRKSTEETFIININQNLVCETHEAAGGAGAVEEGSLTHALFQYTSASKQSHQQRFLSSCRSRTDTKANGPSVHSICH